MNVFLPFALPDIGEEEIAEVVDSLRSGWLTTGPKTKKFEHDFSEFLGGEIEAIAVNSATSGLHLALEAVGVTASDEVITTTHTFTATAEVIRYLGANPIFVDIDPVTLNIDVDKVASAITPRTKAIVPVHLGGLAADMQPILNLARQYNLKVIEDAAHALPTTYQGQTIGTLSSDATVYSFYATKTLATGEGGMLVTRDPEIAKRCRLMRLHGISRDAFDRYTSTKPGWDDEGVAPGFKYNMIDIAASLGIHELRKVKHMQEQRAAIAKYYDDAFADLPIILPAHALVGDIHSWHLYIIRLADGCTIGRNEFIEKMAANGIGCSVHYIPLHLQPYWRDTYHLLPEHFPVASEVYERIVSLPIYTRMTHSDCDRVVNSVRGILNHDN